ncbi:MAG: GAF domain-containing sensor histidine kinase [Anaerolineae bacterium]
MDHDSEAGLTTERQFKLTDTSFKIIAIYAIIGGLWILFSDQLLAALVSDPVTFTRLGMLKGWLYVFVTAGLLYVLIRRAEEAQRASEQQHRQMLEQRVEARTRELSTLLEVSQNVASTLDLGRLLELILEQLKLVVDYSGATVLELEGQDLVVHAYRGPVSQEKVPRMHFPAKYAHHLQVIHSQKPVIIADTRGDDPLAQAFRKLSTMLLEPYYGYVYSCMVAPLVTKGQVIGMLVLHHTEPNYYSAQHANLVMAFANQAAVAIENAQLYEQAQQLAVVEERQRLARELHDSVTQALYSVTLYAQAAHMAMSAGKQDEALENLEELRNMARDAMIDMRVLLFELHPPRLEEEGLAVALQGRLASVETRTGLQTELHMEGERRLPLSVEEELYWIAQEALNNVVKHAQAKKVTVHLQLDEKNVCLEVRDDGIGFEPAEARQSGGMGLRVMEERAERINGKLEVESAPGHGTTLKVRTEVPHTGR